MTSDGSDSEGSDINMKSAVPKSVSNKKMPSSPINDLLDKKLDKKLSTKLMIIQALVDLKSRKGVSMYAIKKYLAERYNVDTEKNKYFIKKSIKSAVEEGTIIQTKGIGASGSFKLAPVKEKKPKQKKPKEKKPKEKKPKEKKEQTEKAKDEIKGKLGKKKKLKENSKKSEDKNSKAKEKSKKTEGKSLKSKATKEKKEDSPIKAIKKKIDTEKMPKEKKDGGVKAKKVKISAVKKPKLEPSPKKKSMAKRKSIGSIIKPPKMKPRAQP